MTTVPIAGLCPRGTAEKSSRCCSSPPGIQDKGAGERSAGVKLPGDVITTAVDGEPATSPDQLTALTITKKAGEKVELAYERNGQSHTTTVTLGTQPSRWTTLSPRTRCRHVTGRPVKGAFAKRSRDRDRRRQRLLR